MGFCLDLHDAVDEHERFVGKTNARGVCVDVSEMLPERTADRSDRKLHELVSIHHGRSGRRPGGSGDRNLVATDRQGPDKFLLPHVFTPSELLLSLCSSKEGLVGLNRRLGGSDRLTQFSRDDSRVQW